MPVRFAIFGGKGGGDTVEGYLDAAGDQAEVLGYLNDTAPRGSQICGRPVLGGFADWRELPDNVQFLAPLHKAKEALPRRSTVQRLGVPGARWGQAIHPMSAISSRASIGPGCCIGPHCDIGPGVTLASHVAMRAGASVAHDVRIGEFVFLGARTVITGYVSLGTGVHIAPGAILRDGITVGDFAVVGLGSVVLADVEPFAIVAGTPAQRIGTIAEAA